MHEPYILPVVGSIFLLPSLRWLLFRCVHEKHLKHLTQVLVVLYCMMMFLLLFSSSTLGDEDRPGRYSFWAEQSRVDMIFRTACLVLYMHGLIFKTVQWERLLTCLNLLYFLYLITHMSNLFVNSIHRYTWNPNSDSIRVQKQYQIQGLPSPWLNINFCPLVSPFYRDVYFISLVGEEEYTLQQH